MQPTTRPTAGCAGSLATVGPEERAATSPTLRVRLYGIRTRLRWFRYGAREAPGLARWVPLSWFLDPMVLADMTSPWERAWIIRHLARHFDGRGAVVELGTWLGASSLAILDGLEKNPRARDTPVHVYDLFREEDIETRFAELPIRGRFRNGESFLPQYLERLGGRASQVTVHAGDILDESWDDESPIGFLFNDVAKGWNIWNHVKDTFYRQLIPGAAVVEQDWVHSCTPWLHLWHYRHRDLLVPEFHVPRSGSMVFRVVDRLPDQALEPDRYEDYSMAETREAFAWAADIVGAERRADVRAALVHLHSMYGAPEVAMRLCIDQLATDPGNDLLQFTVPELARRLADHDERMADERAAAEAAAMATDLEDELDGPESEPVAEAAQSRAMEKRRPFRRARRRP